MAKHDDVGQTPTRARRFTRWCGKRTGSHLDGRGAGGMRSCWRGRSNGTLRGVRQD